VFSLLPFISKRVHKSRMTMETRFSEGVNRYQAVENIRSAKVLNRYVLFLVVFVGFSLVILYVFKEQSGDYYDFVEIVYNIYYAFGGLLSEALVCFSHPVLKSETMGILTGIQILILPKVAKKKSTVRSVQGQELNIGAEQHTTVYFSYYRDSW
ncbi:hypothetical protein PFISCL1PPCAC_7481, partial [Pristionchus fissidentatus]